MKINDLHLYGSKEALDEFKDNPKLSQFINVIKSSKAFKLDHPFIMTKLYVKYNTENIESELRFVGYGFDNREGRTIFLSTHVMDGIKKPDKTCLKIINEFKRKYNPKEIGIITFSGSPNLMSEYLANGGT